MRIRASIVLCLFATASFPGAAKASFPGANGQIAFESFSGFGAFIYTMNPDGSFPGPIETDSDIERSPAWSADGTKLIFASVQNNSFEVVASNPDGTGRVAITRTAKTDGLSPVFSPDGTQIAFVKSNQTGSLDLAVMNADGAGVTTLTSSGNVAIGLDWSSDGARILYSQHDGDFNYSLYQYDIGTATSARLTNLPNVGDLEADYSPDATRVAYVRYSEQGADPRVVNVDGTNDHSIPHVSDGIGGVAWLPDGTVIAVAENRETNEVALVDPDGTDRTVISNEFAFGLAWQSCSGECTISTPRDSTVTIFAINKTKKKLKAFLQLSPVHQGASLEASLFRKVDGVFKEIASKSAVVNEFGNASASFPRPKSGRCKLDVRFAGDEDHKPSSDEARFKCAKGLGIG